MVVEVGEAAERSLAWQTPQGYSGAGSLEAQTILSRGPGLVLGPEKPTFSELGAHQGADESQLSWKDVVFGRVITAEIPQSFLPCAEPMLLSQAASRGVLPWFL